VFDPARLNRHRILAGLNVRVQMIKIGGQFMYDVVDPGKATSTDGVVGSAQSCPGGTMVNGQLTCNPYAGVKRQMTLAFDIGAVF